MSFILDALRKSEHERQRQGGPGLAEVAVAAAEDEDQRLGHGGRGAAGREPDRGRRADAAPRTHAGCRGCCEHRHRVRSPAASQPPAARTSTPARERSRGNRDGDHTGARHVSAARTRAGRELPPMLQPADATAPAAGTRNPLEDEIG